MKSPVMRAKVDHTEDSSPVPTLRHGRKRRTLIAVWFCVGITLIYFDSAIQPYLTTFGHGAMIRPLAEHWQDLGSTLGIVCFLIGGLIGSRRDRYQTFITFALAIAAAGAAVQTVKHLIGRARPNFVHDQTHFYGPFGMWYHGPKIQIDSMPSGHTTAAFAMAVALSYRWRRFAPLWFFLAAGVAVARTLVDRHFPSDVIVAACFGTVIGWSICAARSRHIAKAAIHKSTENTTCPPG